MDKSRLPRRLLTVWVREPRPEFGQEMSYGWSLVRWLKLFDLPLRYTEWATLAQDRAEWARRITLERLAGREDAAYLYQLLADLAEETGDDKGQVTALQSLLASAGPRRASP